MTERMEVERALLASQRLLARTGALARVGGWEYDLATRRVSWSEQTRRLHAGAKGYQPSLTEALAFFTPSSRAIFELALDAAITDGAPFDLELQLVSALGHARWTRCSGGAECEPGQPVRVVAAIQDITLQRTERDALRQSHELLRVTLESIGDGVITTDAAAQIEWMNPVAERMTGWLRTEAQGRHIDEVFRLVHEDTRDPAPCPVLAALALGDTVALAAQSLLLGRNGTEQAVEDSAAPILSAAGAVLGSVLVFHDVSEQRRQSREMAHRATHDALTGLVNREAFESYLHQALQRAKDDSSVHALLFIDLDQFKLVNDACGHSAGDVLLKQISTLLRRQVRERDTVARLGGDEFGMILDDCGLEQAQRIGQQICDQMEEFRFIHDGRRFRLGTSIGLVTVDDHWPSVAALLMAADTACYAAKEAGRNRVHTWFDTDRMLQARRGDVGWTHRLERALDDNLFQLYAQCIQPLAPRPGAGLHCEILLRLREGEGGVVAPAVFMPAAERFHLAPRIDRWVVRELFAVLLSLGARLASIDLVAINLSGQSVGDHAFRRDLKTAIAGAGFDVRKLCFEITETAAITNLADARAFIEELRALGVKVALDDFGAGSSSFAYLKMLPVDILKIDGQFVTNMLHDKLDAVALRCFQDVARTAGLRTIAECVESQDVCDALRVLGVDMIQGFLTHRPEPLQQVLAQLDVPERPMA